MMTSPYTKALQKLNKLNKQKLRKGTKRPKLEERTFALSRSAYKALCRAAGSHNLPVSVYLELLSMQSDLMALVHAEAK